MMNKETFLKAAAEMAREKKQAILKNKEFYTNIGEYYKGYLMGIIETGMMVGSIKPEEKWDAYEFLRDYKD